MEEYTFQGESYTREELEQIALEKGYSFEELLQKNPSIELVGKQTGVPGQAANVTPENVAAVTGLASGTSLSESQRLAAPIAQPAQQENNQIKKADLSSMGLEEQAKVLYANKINSPFFTSLDDIQKGKITREQVTEAAYKRGQYKSKNYDIAYADYISNYEETLPISQKYLRETGIDPFAPEIDQSTATAFAQTAVDNSIYNLGPDVNLENDETLQTISNNSIQELVDNDKYLQQNLIPNVIQTIVLPKVDTQKKILAEKYNLNSANFNIEDYEKANEELNNFFNKTISTELTSNNAYNNRINTIKKAVNDEVQKNLTQAGRDRLGLDEKTSLGETLEKSLKGIGNAFRASLVATLTESSLSNQNKIETYERLLATGEMDENTTVTIGGSVSAKTGARIGGKRVKVREAIKLLQEQNIRIKSENLGRLKEYYDTQGDLTFYKDALQDIENSNTFEEFIGKVIKNTPNLIVEQLPQLGLALSGVGVFAQELGPAYFDTIYAQMDKDGIEHTEENFLDYLESGKGDIAIASSSAAFQQVLETVGGATIAGAIYKNIGKKEIASIMKLGVKEWAQKGGYKALVAGGNKSALTEALTETFQTAVNQLAKGISIQDAGKYFDPNEIMKSGAVGGYVGFLLPFGGNLARQSATDVRGAAARINALTDKDASINILDNLRKDIQLDIDNNVISKEEGEAKLNAVTDVINADPKIRKEITGEDKVKAVELQVEKQQIENEIKNLDEDVDKTDLEGRKTEIIKELNDLLQKNIGKVTTEGAKRIAKSEGIGFQEFETTADTQSFIEKEKAKGTQIEVTPSENYGFIIQDKNTGTQTIVLNKETAKEDNVVTTAAHELLHGVLKNTFTSAEIQTTLGRELAIELGNMDVSNIVDSEYARRLNTYLGIAKRQGGTAKQMGNAWEEGITLLSEGLLTGQIKYNETVFTKIGDFIRQALSQLGVKASFNTGRDVFNFVKDYNKSLVAGQLTAGQQRVVREGAGGALIQFAQSQEGKQQLKVIPEQEIKQSIKAKDIDQAYADGKSAFEISELYRPLVTKLANKYSGVPGFDTFKEDLIQNTLTEKGGAIDLINAFDGRGKLSGYVGKFLPERMKTEAKNLFPDKFAEDVEGRVDIAAQETLPEQVERQELEKKEIEEAKAQETRNVIDRLGLSEDLKETAFEAASKTLSTILPQIQDKKGKNFRERYKVDVRNLLFDDIESEFQAYSEKEYYAKINEKPTQEGGKSYAEKLYDIIPLQDLVKSQFAQPLFTDQVFEADGKPKRVYETFTGKKSYAGNFVYNKKPWSEVKNTFLNEFGKKNKNWAQRQKFIINTVAKELAFDESMQALKSKSVQEKLPLTQEAEIELFNEEFERNIERGRFTKYSIRAGEWTQKNPENANLLINTIGAAVVQKNPSNTFSRIFIPLAKKANIPNLTNEDILVIATEIDQGYTGLNASDANGLGQEYENIFGTNTDNGQRIGANPQSKDNSFTPEEKNVNLELIQKHYKNSDLASALGHFSFYDNQGLRVMFNAPVGTKEYFKFSDNIKEFLLENDIVDSVNNIISLPIVSDVNATEGEKKHRRGKEYNKKGIVEKSKDSDKYVDDLYERKNRIEKSMFKVDLDYINRLGELKEGSIEKQELQKEFQAHRDLMAFVMYSLYKGANGMKNSRTVMRGSTYTIGTALYGTGPVNQEFADTYFEHIPATTIRQQKQVGIYRNALDATTLEERNKIIEEGNKTLQQESTGLFLDNRWKRIFTTPGNKEISGFIYDNINNITIGKAVKAAQSDVETAKKPDVRRTAKIFLDWVKDENGNIREESDLRKELAAKINSAEGQQQRIEDLKAKGIDVSNIDYQAYLSEKERLDAQTNETITVKSSLRAKQISDMIDGIDTRGRGERAQQIKSGKNTEVIAKRLSEKAGLNFRNKWNLWLPYEAEDFWGLIQKIARSGKLGEQDVELLKEELIDPYVQGVLNLNAQRKGITDTYNNSVAQLKKINSKIKLRKTIKQDNLKLYTNEDAVRIYLWDKRKYSIPELQDNDLRSIRAYMNANPELKEFAEKIDASFGKEGYPAPENNWDSGNIAVDTRNMINKISRPKFLKPWISNIEKLLTAKNKNKLIAAFGTDYVNELENTIQRAKSGKNRIEQTGVGGKAANATIDYINDSVGTIMFFNTRSGILQMISFTNYINYSDNNIVEYGKALGNRKQFAADVKTLWNSDFLINRRGGSTWNIQEAEIVEALNAGGNKTSNVFSLMRRAQRKTLEAGFIPTKFADSAAIVLGGAPFYRNRINTYLKQGMSLKAAEEKALLDWKKLSNTSQQASDPLRVSNVQSGPLGRFVFAFNNVLFQYNRLAKRELTDLKKGRRVKKEDGTYMNKGKSALVRLSRVSYYMIAQNAVFQGLQSGLFALAFSGEDDEATEKQKEKREKLISRQQAQAANGMADALLRGSGYMGAIISMMKNYGLEVREQRGLTSAWQKKGGTEETVLEVATLSPPIDHKIRKLSNFTSFATKNNTYETFLPPSIEAASEVLALGNIPADRLLRKAENLYNASTVETSIFNKILLAGGWNAWNLGLEGKKFYDKDGNFKGFGPHAEEGETPNREIKERTIKPRKIK
jgi:hypothetical protein